MEEVDAYDEERENSKNWARRTVILLWEKCTMLDDTADTTDTTDACTLEGRPQVQVRIHVVASLQVYNIHCSNSNVPEYT